MKYLLKNDEIKIFDKTDFDISQTLQCGQVFSYKKLNDGFLVLSGDKKAIVTENYDEILIKADDVAYFERYFDLKTDYQKIKSELSKHEIMQKPIEHAGGIRILRQNLFETLISFIVSANNNIIRIQQILNRLRENFGTKCDGFFAFPTSEQLCKASVQDFASLGAGYRAKYLFEVVRQIDENGLKNWENLPTKELRNKLVALSGVGPKVADCVLLFGYGRGDVFPVDTWIEKMYNKFYAPLANREKIRENLVSEFGELSGYAQQYLFEYIRKVNNEE